MPRATAKLLHREQVAPGHYLLYLRCPEIAAAARPGQFVHLRVSRGIDPLLRRPFSVMLAEPGSGHIRLLVRVAGRGTEAIASHAEGTEYDLLGPLGNGWELPGDDEDVFLVGGGVGVAPLIFLADHLRMSDNRSHVHSLQGAASEELLVCWTEFSSRCDQFTAATEDGSAGEEGLITRVLAAELGSRPPDRLYTCGPQGMLAAVARMCAEAGVPCQVSMEQWMGCGVGACLGCVVPAAAGPDSYVRVCTEGPVFDANDIAWDRMQS
ncbi:MAG TPA: dihydroorotate dehydrogenase electron transfer subunit [Armatimonadota bacterium]|nr:dihydroorotate dehydrogenase electron transfer subunit [Armatimonadota bacterium]